MTRNFNFGVSGVRRWNAPRMAGLRQFLEKKQELAAFKSHQAD